MVVVDVLQSQVVVVTSLVVVVEQSSGGSFCSCEQKVSVQSPSSRPQKSG